MKLKYTWTENPEDHIWKGTQPNFEDHLFDYVYRIVPTPNGGGGYIAYKENLISGSRWHAVESLKFIDPYVFYNLKKLKENIELSKICWFYEINCK